MLSPYKTLLSDTTDITVIMPTQSLQQTALRFSQRHPACAERVYRNTLAVGVVEQYFRLLGIETGLVQSDSWNPVLQVVNDVADLYLPDYGRVECRVTEVDTNECYVPADVSYDRVAYIIVGLNLELAQPEAVLLGFTSEVLDEWVPLSTLRNLSELPLYLSSLKSKSGSKSLQVGVLPDISDAGSP